VAVKVLARGAEAVIYLGWFLGERAVYKERVRKSYRHPEIDSYLRRVRTLSEARIMVDARRAGFPTPHIFDVDADSGVIVMEYVEGERARDWINRHPDDARGLLFSLGRMLGRLHSAGIVHGDLTTSNIIISAHGPVFIDMGMGSRGAGVEEFGVDLHLFKEALESTHSHIEGLFQEACDGYADEMPIAEKVFERVRDIEKRGRYT